MNNSHRPSADCRAWVEVDLGAIAHNAAVLRSCLARGCELMAVVKADAYGHGAERVAAHLRGEGVTAFAVATVDEGVRLRESVPEREILVLGYTHPKDARFLNYYHLTQLAVDGAYARELNATGLDLPVHIAVDTGMHRLGIDASDITEIEGIFLCKNLNVQGIASHLASSDSLDAGDIEFTNTQIKRYFDVVDELRRRGRDVGKLHIQASYGIINYPGLECDYARAGIALYGIMSHNAETIAKPNLRPALSLRARVAEVRRIAPGESVSYGRTFTAAKPMMLATLCIGYADGVPRQLSGNGGMCIIRGRKAPIVGRICMDLLMADVTDIGPVTPGDTATLIGSDGDESIRCEDVAESCSTITNDILSRLGPRLPRVYV